MTNGIDTAVSAATASSAFARSVTGNDPRHVIISRMRFFRSEPLIPTHKPAAIQHTSRKPARYCAHTRPAGCLAAARPRRNRVRAHPSVAPRSTTPADETRKRLDNHVQRGGQIVVAFDVSRFMSETACSCSSVNKSARPSGSTNRGEKGRRLSSSTAVSSSRQLRNQRTSRRRDPATQRTSGH